MREISSRGKVQHKMVTGPVSIPFICLEVRDWHRSTSLPSSDSVFQYPRRPLPVLRSVNHNSAPSQTGSSRSLQVLSKILHHIVTLGFTMYQYIQIQCFLTFYRIRNMAFDCTFILSFRYMTSSISTAPASGFLLSAGKNQWSWSAKTAIPAPQPDDAHAPHKVQHASLSLS